MAAVSVKGSIVLDLCGGNSEQLFHFFCMFKIQGLISSNVPYFGNCYWLRLIVGMSKWILASPLKNDSMLTPYPSKTN